MKLFLALSMITALAACGGTMKQPDLIPRDILFGNPQKARPNISPDGKHLAYLAPLDGVLNIWVRTIGRDDDRVVTHDTKRGIRSYGWAWDSRHLLYIQDKDGDENWHIYGVAFQDEGAKPRDLTPFDGIQAQFVATSKKVPGTILVGLNKENPRAHDVYRLEIASGKLELDTRNPGNVMGWDANDKLEVLASTVMNPDGGSTIMLRDRPEAEWKPFITHGPDDSAGIGTFSDCGRYAWVRHNLKSDKTCLYRVDLATGEEKLVFEPEKADLGGVFTNMDTHEPLAVSVNYLKREWHLLDDSVAGDFEAIRAIREGEFSVVDRDMADENWIVAFITDDGPVYYYAYERASRKATLLFSHRPELEDIELSKMTPVVIKARDGMDLVCYLTLPAGKEPKKLPMVLNVHGGPWARDSWGFDPYHQWLANRGYAVLAVNFRGSTGFGKAYLNAGNRQWAAKMHDDLIDAVNWAIGEGVADRERVAILGASYGGYATLAAATFTPDVFCCGVDIVGPSNMMTLIQSIPPYWAPMLNVFRHRVGDWEKDPAYFESISPLFKVDAITMPLLIGQGRNDPRVKVQESLQIVEAMEKKGKEVMYIEFPDEGHGFARPENNMAFNAAVEKFLAKHLGGRFEPAGKDEQEILEKVTKK